MDMWLVELTGVTLTLFYIVLLVLRMLLVPSIIVTAYMQRRNVLVWGIFSLLFPILAWVVYLGTKPKADKMCYAWQKCANR